MADNQVDPRAAELLRRRAEKNGATASAAPAPEPRKLDDAGRAEIRAIAAAHPKWTARDIADAFEGEHGWRPTPQGIGRTLADHGEAEEEGEAGGETQPRRAGARKPAAHGHADPEVGAMSMVAMALSGLDAAEIRRVLAWARARFEEGGGA